MSGSIARLMNACLAKGWHKWVESTWQKKQAVAALRAAVGYLISLELQKVAQGWRTWIIYVSTMSLAWRKLYRGAMSWRGSSKRTALEQWRVAAVESKQMQRAILKMMASTLRSIMGMVFAWLAPGLVARSLNTGQRSSRSNRHRRLSLERTSSVSE